MKIEKVSENQIRCTLSKEELANRQIKLSELAYGSEKAKVLFRDMIEQANYEFGFEVEDIPVMIEAIPLSGEKIILQITKVEYPEELDTRFSKFSEGGTEIFESAEDASLFSEIQGADDILGLFQKMKEDLQQKKTSDVSAAENILPENKNNSQKPIEKKLVQERIETEVTKLFVTDSLDNLERLSYVLDGFYEGENHIYKDENKNCFYLLVRKNSHTPEEFNKVCNIISEYASYKKYNSATEAFFKEHMKLLLKDNALQVLESIAK